MKKMFGKKIFVLAVAAALLGGLIFTSGYVNAFAAEATQPVNVNYYTSDYDSKREALDAANKFNEDIYGEGVVMLKNDAETLPLAKNSKISLFGKNSAGVLAGGSGAGGGTGLTPRTIHESLREAGFELNPALVRFYNNNAASGAGRGPEPLNPDITSGYNTGETPVDMYTSELEASYENYNDVALVVISRISGEGFELPRTMTWDGSSYRTWSDRELVPGARNKTDHYLQLDQNEADMIKYVGDRFDKVVVLLNTGSTFETGFLDDPAHYAYHANVKGAMWIGYGGTTGIMSLGKILNGTINPSGKTTNALARDFKQDPAWKNTGNNNVQNGNIYAGSFIQPYVYYKEGIYVGYRYWETRGYTEGFDVPYNGELECGTATTAWDSWYDAHVVYPFGYGLSYTDFKWELIGQTPAAKATLTADGTISVSVKVTNTGDKAGKDVVQLYYTAPYNPSQKSTAIEKSHVVLGAFGKTKLLQPDESATLTLKIKVRDMASYDYADLNGNGFKGYEVEEGNYQVRLMRNSHTQEAVVDYVVPKNGFKYETGENNDFVIENQFDEVSNETGVTLSRANWTGTFPTTALNIQAKPWIVEKTNEWNGTVNNIPDAPGQPYYTENMPTTGNDTPTNGVVMSDLVGLDYDDPLWGRFLDQLSVPTMQSLIGAASHASGRDVPALGITRVTNADGPAGFHYMTPGPNAFYASETILAATWNTDLAYKKGLMMGNEGLHGTGDPNSRYPGWYAPGVNIHRTPFSGRNYEYYSEDGFLSGKMASRIVAGGNAKGLFSYVKHFALNDQETNRVGLLVWANEQSMREIYFKGFELCVKEGKATAIMSACNRIGPVWAGGNYGLLTNILRNEWEFRGTVVTDAGLHSYMNSDQSLRMGGDLMLSQGAPSFMIEGATAVTALRRVAHDYLYTHANSMAMNTAASAAPARSLNVYTGSTLMPATVGLAYSAKVATATVNKVLHPDGNDADIVYSLAEGSELPAGLSFSADGSIDGTPTEEVNDYKFTVVAEYRDYQRSATFIINVIDSNGAIVFSGSSDLGVLTVGEATAGLNVNLAQIYKQDATQEEIDRYPAIKYALKNGSLLPAGLTLSPAGVISGTPTKECRDYKFKIEASAMGYKSKDMTFTLSVFNELEFTGKTLKSGKFGEKYLDRVTPAVCDKTVTYELAPDSALPKGLTLTKDGYIVGTPTTAVTGHTFTVRAVADYCVVQEAEYTLTIGLVYNEFMCPDGKAGEAYSASADFAQGVSGIEYALKSGSSLPEGLTFANGVLSGTPVKAGVYELTFTAAADGYAGAETTITLYIANADAATGCGANFVAAGSITALIALLGIALLRAVVSRPKNKKENQ